MSSPIDRLAHTARAIRTAAALTAPTVTGPYSCAVLATQLGDLIRDIDPSELCLFTPTPQLTRAEFTPATPLRKPPSRRDDASKPADFDPETYAQAAIKCIARYEAIRPMPRTYSQALDILERLKIVRQSIVTLNETLLQAQSASGSPINALIESEENRIQALQSQLAELNRRKLDATSKQRIRGGDMERSNQKAHTTSFLSSPHEEKFWNTRVTAARTLRFADNLMDEQVDLGDITTTSFMSPLPPSPSIKIPLVGEAVTPLERLIVAQDHSLYDDHSDSTKDSTGRADSTVIHSSSPPTSQKSDTNPPSPTPEANQPDNHTLTVPSVKPPKVPLSTEVERFVAKIWATMGDAIMPGHPYDLSGRGIGSKPPRAKETISHLRSLAQLSLPSLASPPESSVSSSSSGRPLTPTAQQILTAHLLLSLLSSPPHFSMPLNEAKGLLVAKAGAGGTTVIAGQGTSRILYGCVAKRLIKIERGKGEQIVKFDV